MPSARSGRPSCVTSADKVGLHDLLPAPASPPGTAPPRPPPGNRGSPTRAGLLPPRPSKSAGTPPFRPRGTAASELTPPPGKSPSPDDPDNAPASIASSVDFPAPLG